MGCGKIFSCTSGGAPADPHAALRNANQELQRANTQLSKSETALQQRVASLENTIKELNTTVTDLTKSLEKSNNQNKKLHASVGRLRVSADNYNYAATLAKNAISNIFRAAITLSYGDSLYSTAMRIMDTIALVGKAQQNLITECWNTARNKPQPQHSPVQLDKIPLLVTATEEPVLLNNLVPVEPPSPVDLPSPPSQVITPTNRPTTKEQRRKTAPPTNGSQLPSIAYKPSNRRASQAIMPSQTRGKRSAVAS